MTTHVVPDDRLGRIFRKETDLNRRITEETLDPNVVEEALEYLDRGLQAIIEGRPVGTPTTTPEEAAAIMGTNFHGIDQVEGHFSVKFTAKQRNLLEAVPFSAEVLRSCSDTHILVAGFGLTLMDVHAASKGLFYSKTNPWYGEADQRFASKTKVTVAWHLVRKTPLPNSTSKSWTEQQALVGAQDYIPPACLVAYTAILHAMVTGERILPNIYARTSDVTAGGRRVRVGRFDSVGLDVSGWDGGPNSYLGVAVSRKFN